RSPPDPSPCSSSCACSDGRSRATSGVCRCVKHYGQVLDAVDEVRPQACGIVDGRDARHALNELLEEHPDLEPGEAGPEAEVRAAPTERDVRVRLARHVEPERLVEDVFVTVRR